MDELDKIVRGMTDEQLLEFLKISLVDPATSGRQLVYAPRAAFDPVEAFKRAIYGPPEDGNGS
jgi:hypothetical protein